MINKMIVLGLLSATMLGGCANKSFLATQYAPARANLGDQPIEVAPTPTAETPKEMVNADPSEGELPNLPEREVVTGTWTFTTPPTVTRMERKNGELSQFSLYNGRPAADAKPFVVITVAPATSESGSQAEAEPGTYKVSETRSYVLNGNIAQEWTGLTSDGAAFCELVVRRPGSGTDVCHAMAIARTSAERELALKILGSLTWTAR